MGDFIARESDDEFASLRTERANDHEQPRRDVEIGNDNNSAVAEETAVGNLGQVGNDDDGSEILNLESRCLDAGKSSFDSNFIVHDMLFDMKSDETSSANADDKYNVKSYNNSDGKNTNFCLPATMPPLNASSETARVLSSANEATTYSDINNTTTLAAGKKHGFSVEEISKDETSQNGQSVVSTMIYSNDYTCFLSEQTDAVSNLTPFKRSNSYYFDSPVKKLCTAKSSSGEGSRRNADGSSPIGTSYSNENDKLLYAGFTSIQNDLEDVDCVQDRYDGSDSGFGSELAEDKNSAGLDAVVSTSSLLYKNDFTLNRELNFEDLQRTSNEFLSAMEVLKPKFTDCLSDTSPLDVASATTTANYGIVVKGILKRDKFVDYGILTPDDATAVKKRRNINFANVTVFYFPRVQGFTCVPSQGGSTLGMTRVHSASRVFSLPEYIAEQRRIRRNMIQLNHQSEVSGTNSDDSDSDVAATDVYSESEADVDSDSNGSFLQPVPTRQRRALLKAAGVEKIDSSEKDDCKNIRLSREFCGCLCRGFCDPDTCACFQAGITCQVDRMNFPCGCTVDGCGNSVGRIEFNPTRVRKHFIHTIMKLEIKKREAQEEEHCKKLAMTSSSPLISNFSYHDTRHIQPYYQPQHYEHNLNDYNYHSFLPVYDGHHVTTPDMNTLNGSSYQLGNTHTLYEPYQSFSSAFAPLSQDRLRGPSSSSSSSLSIVDKPETFTELLQPYSLQQSVDYGADLSPSFAVPSAPGIFDKDGFNLETDNLGEIIKNTMVETVNS